jgi:hypothetical protein
MLFSFNHQYFNAPYINGFHLSTARTFNEQIIQQQFFNYIKGKDALRLSIACVPGLHDRFALSLDLCLSYCLTRVPSNLVILSTILNKSIFSQKVLREPKLFSGKKLSTVHSGPRS